MSDEQFELLLDHIWAAGTGVVVALLAVHEYKKPAIAELIKQYQRGRESVDGRT